MLAHSLVDNFCYENNLYNVISTMLQQHCRRILSIEYRDDLKICVNKTFKVGELHVSQKPAIIKLIEKRTKIND